MGGEFDFEAPGSRFTMRPAMAVQIGGSWREASESRSGVAAEAVVAELGPEWLENDPDLGELRAVDGVRGRGAAGWIPVLEWLGLTAVQLGVVEALRAGIRRVWNRTKEDRSAKHRFLISRGFAALLAMEHVFESTDEQEILNVEFVQEPSVIGGRPPSETSYTGLEPWIVSLVNGSRKTRYVLVVSPEGDVQGCIAAEAGEFDPMYGLLPPVE